VQILSKIAEYLPSFLSRTDYASSTFTNSTPIYASSHFYIRSPIGNITALYRNVVKRGFARNQNCEGEWV